MGQWSHLYARRGWRVARAEFLRRHPLCVMCERAGKVGAATVVDHIEPHRGDMRKFWQRSNWQALCATHHSSTKQHQEKTEGGCDTDGNPLRPMAHWLLP